MEVYESEQDQIDAIKRWWRENGKAVIIGVVLGFGSLFGWQQWQANTKAQRETASLEYNVLLSELQSNNYQGVKDRGARILNDFQSTSYAALAALALAKVYVEEGDLTSARTYLQTVLDHSDQTQLQHVARLRLGRLLLAEDQAAQALSLIDKVDSGGFASSYDELKGDVHAAMGNVEQARQAYQLALAGLEPGLDRNTLQMKLDDLGGSEVKP